MQRDANTVVQVLATVSPPLGLLYGCHLLLAVVRDFSQRSVGARALAQRHRALVRLVLSDAVRPIQGWAETSRHDPLQAFVCSQLPWSMSEAVEGDPAADPEVCSWLECSSPFSGLDDFPSKVAACIFGRSKVVALAEQEGDAEPPRHRRAALLFLAASQTSDVDEDGVTKGGMSVTHWKVSSGLALSFGMVIRLLVAQFGL